MTQTDGIPRDRIPRHIAIIMDGNGRWAHRRAMPRVAGHQAGIRALREIVKAAGEAGVGFLTLYAFSVENWSRPAPEVSALMGMLLDFLDREMDEMRDRGLRLRAIGRLDDLPPRVLGRLREAIDATAGNDKMTLTLALSYGGRTEIADAARRLAEEARAGRLDPAEISPDVFARYLYAPDLPDPDLVIRTSGELRLSNFLLWQSSYAEFYVTETLWPDFGPEEFLNALREFAGRERRFGRVTAPNGGG